MAGLFKVVLLGYGNFKISTRHVQINNSIIAALLAKFPLNFKALLAVFRLQWLGECSEGRERLIYMPPGASREVCDNRIITIAAYKTT